MKTLIVIIASSFFLCACISIGGHAACPTGYTEAHPGVCSQDLKPEGAPTSSPTTDTKWVSSEKPPKHPEPSWQRGDVMAATPPSLVSEDAKLDAEKAQAEAEGKRKAGIR